MNLLAVLSSYWSTDLFSSKQQPPCVTKTGDTPPFFPLLLSQWENLWRSLETQRDQHLCPPPSEEMSESVPSRSWLSGRGAACMSVMGCGRGTEAPGQTVNNYRDVGALERGAALTAVTHTRGTVRRWRTVRLHIETLPLTINYGLSYESTETGQMH